MQKASLLVSKTTFVTASFTCSLGAALFPSWEEGFSGVEDFQTSASVAHTGADASVDVDLLHSPPQG